MAIKPLLSHSTTGEFNSPFNYSQVGRLREALLSKRKAETESRRAKKSAQKCPNAISDGAAESAGSEGVAAGARAAVDATPASSSDGRQHTVDDNRSAGGEAGGE
eukprot:9124282-Pyramimonas_sp.AAC.1